MVLLDTSGLLAALDAGQNRHAQCAQALLEAAPPLLLSPFVLAELDYLLARHVGAAARAALLEEVGRGAYRLERFEADDITAALKIIARYADLKIGLAEASIVVLAQRHGTRDVLTLDERHFRALRIRKTTRFRVLPADRRSQYWVTAPLRRERELNARNSHPRDAADTEQSKKNSSAEAREKGRKADCEDALGRIGLMSCGP